MWRDTIVSQEMGVSIDNMQKWTQDATLRFTRRKAPPASVVLQQMKQQQASEEGAPPGPPPAAEASLRTVTRPATNRGEDGAASMPRALATAAGTGGLGAQAPAQGSPAREALGEASGGGDASGPLVALGEHWDEDYDSAAELLMPWR